MTQDNISLALEQEYQIFSFYQIAANTYATPFNELANAKMNIINTLNSYLQNTPVLNSNENLVLPDTLEETLQLAINKEYQNIDFYNNLINTEIDSQTLDTFYLLQAASYNNSLPLLQNALNTSVQQNLLNSLKEGKNLLDETGAMINQLKAGQLSQENLESFLNKLNYSLIGGAIAGAFGAIIFNEFLNQNKE